MYTGIKQHGVNEKEFNCNSLLLRNTIPLHIRLHATAACPGIKHYNENLQFFRFLDFSTLSGRLVTLYENPGIDPKNSDYGVILSE